MPTAIYPSLRDRVVIITGGGQGLGRAYAHQFAAQGAIPVIAEINEENGARVVREIEQQGGRALAVRTDVSDEASARGMAQAALGTFGRIDCLINNAGWHPPHKPIDELTAGDFRDLLELNLVSVFVACQEALPHLRRTRGSIINMSSLVGSMGQLHATTYVATKGAVTAFTKALAVDEAAHDVRVNVVSPGNVMTPLWQEAIDAAPDPAACKAAGETAQLLGRMGTIEEAGRLCLFLAAEATFTTGVDHILSGGAELAYGRKTRKG